MDFIRAFSYIFDDQEWASKLIIVAMMAFTVVLFPFGLIALAVLLGYGLQLAVNVREGMPNPLPRWDNITQKLTSGAQILIAWLVYFIPGIALSACLTLTLRELAVILLCCLAPLALIYSLVVSLFLMAGTIRFIETGEASAFYRLDDLLAFISLNLGAMLEWLLLSFLANFALGFIGLIPCIGWLIVLAATVPVQSHLLGQLARVVREKTKQKPKRA